MSEASEVLLYYALLSHRCRLEVLLESVERQHVGAQLQLERQSVRHSFSGRSGVVSAVSGF